MKYVIALLLLTCSMASTFAADVEMPYRVTKGMEAFDKDVAKATADFIKVLEREEERATKDGNLDLALAIRAKRTEVEKTLPKAAPIDYSHISAREWDRLNGMAIEVRGTYDSDNPLVTELVLQAGKSYTVIPCPTDKWCGSGSRTGVFCDFRGYDKGGIWMRMHVRVGNMTTTDLSNITGDGVLKLFAADEHSSDNTGMIRVKVVEN